MHNLQTIETLKKAKNRVRTKFSVDARMLKPLTNHLRSWIDFIFIFVLLFLLFKIHAYFTNQTLQLQVLTCSIKKLRVTTKRSGDASTLNACLGILHDFFYFIIAHI